MADLPFAVAIDSGGSCACVMVPAGPPSSAKRGKAIQPASGGRCSYERSQGPRPTVAPSVSIDRAATDAQGG